jgi:type I restriction enzyme S subunit
LSAGLGVGYKQTEMGVIPDDWDVGALGDLNPFVTSGSRGWANFYSDRGSLFVRITNMLRDSIYLDLENQKFVNLPAESSEGIRTQLQEHDVLISITADIGIISYIDSHVPTPAYINQHIALVRFDQAKTCGKFVSYFLASEKPQKLFRASTDTGAKAGMSLSTVQKIEIALPPVPEQRNIAAALSDVDALLGGLDSLIAKKRDLKQAAMQQLLTGQTRLPGFSGEWEAKRLGDVADIDPDNLGSNTPSDYEFKYISLEDVDSGVLIGHSEQVFSVAPSRARRKLQNGDILVSTVRPNLQSHLLFQIDAPHWICSTGFAVVRCRTGVTNPAYVFPNLFGSGVSQQIETLLTGSNYPAINSKDVRALEIPIPPYAEQTAIATVLADMDTELVKLVARRKKTQGLKQAMMQELLTGRIRLV